MKKFIITSSVGNGKTELTSFDNALINCRIANYNLVKVSSILPAGCKQLDFVDIEEGNVLFTAYASVSSNKKGEKISAAIGVGIPKDKTKIGVIMECSGVGDKEIIENQLREMIIEAMDSRGYEIKKILCKSVDVESRQSDTYVTAFAAISMW